MFRKYLFLIIIACIPIVLLSSNPYAFEGKTHSDINKYIAENTLDGFSLNTYLIDELGIQGGAQISFEYNKVNKTITNWLGYGGEMEDDPLLRTFNHFYNPLTNQGLKGIITSSLAWTQLPAGMQSPGGKYSWHDVRGYFYNALTAIDETTRDNNFADTFRGLGQLIHLVQDSSVPWHTRDDAHPGASLGYGKIFSDYYEKWVAGKNKLGEPNFIIDSSIAPIFFDYSEINESNSIATVPIANLVDMNKYAGSDPDPSVTLSSAIGLAEYSNANFLSDDTMFSGFSYPYILETKIIKDEDNNKWYFTSNGIGEKVDHLARISAASILRNIFLTGNLTRIPAIVDEVCYKDYADLLIPRAMGYSSQLLKYFFRGTIEVSIPADGFYAMTDNTVNGFTSIKLKALNTTENSDAMTNGTIQLVVKYRLSSADPFKNYTEGEYPDTSDDFYYIVASEKNGTSAIPSGSAVELSFDLSETPVPLWATDVYLQVVYKGVLGNEKDAIAVGFKDISEPTPIELFNNMDKICLDTTWYDAGSAAAIAYVDNLGNMNGVADEWDVYSHDLQDIYYRFYPAGTGPYQASSAEGEHQYYIGSVKAGEFDKSLYILSDYEYECSYIATPKVDSSDSFIHYNMQKTVTWPAIKNQFDWDGAEYIRAVGTFYEFRGVLIWGGIRAINKSYPDSEDTEACLYEELE